MITKMPFKFLVSKQPLSTLVEWETGQFLGGRAYQPLSIAKAPSKLSP